MINTLQHTIEKTGIQDINKAIKSVAFYTWISAGVLFACYLYVIGAITFSVIKERGLEQDTKSLISTMGQQELQYLTSQKTLTKDYALQHGFIPAPVVSFAVPQKAFAWNVGH